MWKKHLIGASIAATVIIFGVAMAYHSMVGAGGFKRLTTLTGIYAVCKPGGYSVVCFADADSKEGGLSCLPLEQAGGKCQ